MVKVSNFKIFSTAIFNGFAVSFGYPERLKDFKEEFQDFPGPESTQTHASTHSIDASTQRMRRRMRRRTVDHASIRFTKFSKPLHGLVPRLHTPRFFCFIISIPERSICISSSKKSWGVGTKLIIFSCFF